MDEHILYKIATYLGKETLNLRFVFKGVGFLDMIGTFMHNRELTHSDPKSYLKVADIVEAIRGNIISTAFLNPNYVTMKQVFTIAKRYGLFLKTTHYVYVVRLSKLSMHWICKHCWEQHADCKKSEECDELTYDAELFAIGLNVKVYGVMRRALCYKYDPPDHLYDAFVESLTQEEVIEHHGYTLNKERFTEAVKRIRNEEIRQPPVRYLLGDGYFLPPGMNKKERRKILKDHLSGRNPCVFICHKDFKGGDKLAARVFKKEMATMPLYTKDRIVAKVEHALSDGDMLDKFICVCYHCHLMAKDKFFGLLDSDRQDAFDQLKDYGWLYDIVEKNAHSGLLNISSAEIFYRTRINY